LGVSSLTIIATSAKIDWQDRDEERFASLEGDSTLVCDLAWRRTMAKVNQEEQKL
jgi:hypothetical protein